MPDVAIEQGGAVEAWPRTQVVVVPVLQGSPSPAVGVLFFRRHLLGNINIYMWEVQHKIFSVLLQPEAIIGERCEVWRHAWQWRESGEAVDAGI